MNRHTKTWLVFTPVIVLLAGFIYLCVHYPDLLLRVFAWGCISFIVFIIYTLIDAWFRSEEEQKLEDAEKRKQNDIQRDNR